MVEARDLIYHFCAVAQPVQRRRSYNEGSVPKQSYTPKWNLGANDTGSPADSYSLFVYFINPFASYVTYILPFPQETDIS